MALGVGVGWKRRDGRVGWSHLKSTMEGRGVRCEHTVSESPLSAGWGWGRGGPRQMNTPKVGEKSATICKVNNGLL